MPISELAEKAGADEHKLCEYLNMSYSYIVFFNQLF